MPSSLEAVDDVEDDEEESTVDEDTLGIEGSSSSPLGRFSPDEGKDEEVCSGVDWLCSSLTPCPTACFDAATPSAAEDEVDDNEEEEDSCSGIDSLSLSLIL